MYPIGQTPSDESENAISSTVLMIFEKANQQTLSDKFKLVTLPKTHAN